MRVVAISILAGLLTPALLFTQARPSRAKNIAERLGHPTDAKLLIIHADDLAVAHSVDDASFAALASGAVTSASVMVPCPWLTEVADWARSHPEADLGLHLTLTSEWKTYRWGPVAPRDRVPSLLNPEGYFWPDVAAAARHGSPEDVETEIRAQLEPVVRIGIRPTHLDIHMGTLAARPEYYAALVRVGHEYHLPFMAVRAAGPQANMLSLLAPTDPVLDALVMFAPEVKPETWTQSYIQGVEKLKPGLNEMIVHLGHDDSELRAVTLDHPDFGAAWRARDLRAVTSPEFRQALAVNHVVLVHWKDLAKLM